MQFVALFAFVIAAAWADDPFPLLHSRITSLSRVVTGVSLINGLTDGSIPTDSVISELLNIPSIKDLENFDKKTVDDTMAKLKDVASKLSDDSKYIEKPFAELHESKEMWNKIGDLKSLPDKQAFEKLKILETMNLKVIEEFKFETMIETLSDKNATEIPNVKLSLESLSAACKDAKTQLEEAGILGVLNSLTPLLQFAEQFTYYKNAAVEYLRSADDNEISSFKANWQSLNSLSVENNLIPVEASDVDSKRIYTLGLVNRFLDIKQLPMDTQDSWILNSTESIKLRKGLESLSKASDGFESLNQKLAPLKKDSITKSIKKLNLLRENLKAIRRKETVLDTAMVSIKKCQLVAINYEFKIDSLKVVSFSRKLQRKVQSIIRISASLEEGSTPITALDSKKTETIDAVLNLMEKLRFDIEDVTSGGTNETATNLLSLTSFVTEFEKNRGALRHSTFFNCIKNATPDSEVLSTAAKLIIDLQNIGSDAEFFANIETAGSAIVGSASNIQNVRKSLKIEKTPETQKLALLKDLKQYSKPLGEASATVTSIHNLLEKNQDVLDVVSYARIVDNGVDMLSVDPRLQNEIRNGWNGFEERSKELVTVMGVVKSRVSSLKEPSNLESLGKGLEGFAGLGDVDLGVGARKDALELLISKLTAHQSLKTGLEKLKESMSHLEDLDLKFSKFDTSLSGMSKTMTELKMVFVNAVKVAVTVPPTTTYTMSGLTENTTKEIEGESLLPLIGLLLGGAFCIGTMALTVKTEGEEAARIAREAAARNNADGQAPVVAPPASVQNEQRTESGNQNQSQQKQAPVVNTSKHKKEQHTVTGILQMFDSTHVPEIDDTLSSMQN
ncbi:hypothetical protein B9Z55_008655 [Caenorhabditis nigoni]|uniref:Domain of unknown function WSN domain-containing protein n=1 Tax=Caenorhabditis nigoni TaxID=1611254 RepID=A0A2G5UNQ9_9PELO|nr:hypothetical protein B9Z55_008655 [Caenorhabditis nigoni]